MLIIPVKEGESIDRALKRFNRKFDRTGKLKSLRERKAYIKPSVRQRDKLIKATYDQRLKDIENQKKIYYHYFCLILIDICISINF